ncbi:hypothetical protein FOL47_007265 [Perkinsus chesapeaki]|uniref:Uncharacterized protein n=1 Tax=Perkinsus chesapeaki TaxID=330153 RepID=A0A7J6LMG0_PERCH|nr:hypothetical protein FOL47_007265 [Perkinsus chesapeaki]
MVPRPRNVCSSEASAFPCAHASVSPSSPELAEPPPDGSEAEEYVLGLGGCDQDEGMRPDPVQSSQSSAPVGGQQSAVDAPLGSPAEPIFSGSGLPPPQGGPPFPAAPPPPGDDQADHARRSVKSEKLTGIDKQANSLEVYEFISRLESRVKAHLKLLSVRSCNHYQYLLLNTRLAAYNALTNNVRLLINDPQAFERGVSVLQERFGVGRHDLWALARLDNLRTAWLTQVREGAPYIETALNLTRSIRVEGHEGVALVQNHYSRVLSSEGKGKGIPTGTGKGKGQRRGKGGSPEG